MRMLSIYQQVHNVLVQVGEIIMYVYPAETTLAAQVVQAAAIASNITAIASEHEGNFSDALQMAEAILKEVESVSRNLTLSLMLARAQQNQSSNLLDQFAAIAVDIQRLEAELEGLTNGHTEVETALSRALEIAAELSTTVSQINQIIAQTSVSLEEAEASLALTYGKLMVSWDSIDTVSNLIGQTTFDPGSGCVSGSGSGSGSGIDSECNELEPTPGDEDTIAVGLVTLRSAVKQLENSVSQCTPIITAAAQHASDLEIVGNEIQR